MIWHYNTSSLEYVRWTWLRPSVSKKHLVVDGPVLMILFKKKLRLDSWIASREVLPPLFGFVCFGVERQLLAVNPDCLTAKLLCVLFDHFLTSSLLNFSSCSSGPVLLLHSQMAHLSCIQSLFCVLYFLKIMFKSFQINKILDSSLFLKLRITIWFWASDKCEPWLANCCLWLFYHFCQFTLFAGFSALLILFLFYRRIFR